MGATHWVVQVAAKLGCRSLRRRPIEDLKELDRELSFFLASGWFELPGKIEGAGLMATPSGFQIESVGRRIFGTAHFTVQQMLDITRHRRERAGAKVISAHVMGSLHEQSERAAERVPKQRAQALMEEGGHVYYYNAFTDDTSVTEPTPPRLHLRGNDWVLEDKSSLRVMPTCTQVVDGALLPAPCAACRSQSFPAPQRRSRRNDLVRDVAAGRYDLNMAIHLHGGYDDVGRRLRRRRLSERHAVVSHLPSVRQELKKCQARISLPAWRMPCLLYTSPSPRD